MFLEQPVLPISSPKLPKYAQLGVTRRGTFRLPPPRYTLQPSGDLQSYSATATSRAALELSYVCDSQRTSIGGAGRTCEPRAPRSGAGLWTCRLER